MPGPETIGLEGVVDGYDLSIDLRAPVLLARLGMSLEEFRGRVWSGQPEPELEENLRGILAYYYHQAKSEEGQPC